MKPYLFIDLDDTLFQTIRKCPESDGLKTAAIARNGDPLSFMTKGQTALFDMFSESMTVIPATARSLDAFRRVRLSFPHGAIIDYGGVIIDGNGKPDGVWDSIIREKAEATCSRLNMLFAVITDHAASSCLRISIRIIGDFDMKLYIVIKHLDADNSELARLHDEFIIHTVPPGFYIHFNDNNIAIIPDYLNKAHAVDYFIETRIRALEIPYVTLGMGDSSTDLAFMKKCDYLIIPIRSQIAGKLP